MFNSFYSRSKCIIITKTDCPMNATRLPTGLICAFRSLHHPLLLISNNHILHLYNTIAEPILFFSNVSLEKTSSFTKVSKL